ncbi:hypothetical protein HPB47_005840 [Ixodes persulcatus]|uniref:Uncharacterized protein n=1 Tax=Ixodes persulcatus TaxID=34615 RepID=A0AC60PBU7_IXOPE|nr:hypothetical protein HPB47_005840 [Ixodes persulcatus]
MSVSISGFPAQRSSVSIWAASLFPIWKRMGKQGRSSDSGHVPRGLPPGYRASAIWPGSSQPHAESESAPSFPVAVGCRNSGLRLLALARAATSVEHAAVSLS